MVHSAPVPITIIPAAAEGTFVSSVRSLRVNSHYEETPVREISYVIAALATIAIAAPASAEDKPMMNEGMHEGMHHHMHVHHHHHHHHHHMMMKKEGM